MPDDRFHRGIPIPSLWQLLVLSALVTAGYLLWAESRNQSSIREHSRLTEAPTEELQSFENLVRQGSDAIPQLLEMLRDADPRTRRNAVLALGRMGTEDVGTLEPVRELLSDGDAVVRWYAFVAFSQICPDQQELLTVAARTLADPDLNVRDQAHNLFVATGRPAVPGVIELLKSDVAVVRRHAIQILVRFNRIGVRVLAADEVRPLMLDSDPEVRSEAIKAIGEWHAAQPEETLTWLRDHDRQIAFCGLRAADWYMPEAAEALPDLIRLIDGADEFQLHALAAALSALQTTARPAVPHLLQVIQTADRMQSFSSGPGGASIGPGSAFLRTELIDALVEIGADPRDLRLVLATTDSDQRWVHGILARIDPDEVDRQVSRLIPQLNSKQTPVIESALRELQGYGGQARTAAPAVSRLINHSNPEVSRAAVSRLIEISPEKAGPTIPFFLAQLKHDLLDPSNAEQPAIEALSRIGPAAKAALPALLTILETPALDPPALKSGNQFNWLRLDSILAVARIGGDDPDVVGALRLLLRGDAWQDRAAAAEALSSPGISTAAVLDDLLVALIDQDAYVRANAALAIGELRGQRIAALEPLIGALQDGDPYVQSAAAIALGHIGRPASPAAEALETLLRNPANTMANSMRGSGLLWRWRPDRLHHRRTVAQAARWAIWRIER